MSKIELTKIRYILPSLYDHINIVLQDYHPSKIDSFDVAEYFATYLTKLGTASKAYLEQMFNGIEKDLGAKGSIIDRQEFFLNFFSLLVMEKITNSHLKTALVEWVYKRAVELNFEELYFLKETYNHINKKSSINQENNTIPLDNRLSKEQITMLADKLIENKFIDEKTKINDFLRIFNNKKLPKKVNPVKWIDINLQNKKFSKTTLLYLFELLAEGDLINRKFYYQPITKRNIFLTTFFSDNLGNPLINLEDTKPNPKTKRSILLEKIVDSIQSTPD